MFVYQTCPDFVCITLETFIKVATWIEEGRGEGDGGDSSKKVAEGSEQKTITAYLFQKL